MSTVSPSIYLLEFPYLLPQSGSFSASEDVDVDRIYLTTRNGPLERPPRFRRSPTAEDVESYGVLSGVQP